MRATHARPPTADELNAAAAYVGDAMKTGARKEFVVNIADWGIQTNPDPGGEYDDIAVGWHRFAFWTPAWERGPKRAREARARKSLRTAARAHPADPKSGCPRKATSRTDRAGR